MDKTGLQTPVLFLIFNRPAHTKKVFEAIKAQKPKYLFIAADGPRNDKPDENEKCALIKKIVLDGVNWECEVKTLFRTENLGCGRAVSEAISWFFESVEEGIILEDDCLPNNSFFAFCEELLIKYRDNLQIMHIGGSNFQNNKRAANYSYYFSNYIHIWGWATWRRAWKVYEFNIPASLDKHFLYALKYKFSNKIERDYWLNSFTGMAKYAIDTWDIQWVYSIFKNAGIGITPSANHVSNIGFDAEATHTNVFSIEVAGLPLVESEITHHPKRINILKIADRHTFKTQFQHGDTRYNRIKFKIGKMFPMVKTLYLNFLAKTSQ